MALKYPNGKEKALRNPFAEATSCGLTEQLASGGEYCLNLSYMRTTLTISLPPTLRRDVSRAARLQRVSESEFIRRAVQRQLWADAFEETRRRLVPKARAQRIYTDEDVFKIVS